MQALGHFKEENEKSSIIVTRSGLLKGSRCLLFPPHLLFCIHSISPPVYLYVDKYSRCTVSPLSHHHLSPGPIIMVQLDVVQACNNALVKKQSVTAVFVGGTSGIGEYAVRALASTHGTSGSGLRVYIVGRNEVAANTIIAECREVCPAGEFHFVRASDLSSLREVDRVCKEIVNAEEANAIGKSACVDLLVMTQAFFAFGGRLERQGTDICTNITPLMRHC